MGTLKQEMEGGCLSRALPDEPLFVVMGRDDQAPERVRDWAAQRASDVSLGKRPESDLAVVQEAYECADRMDEWRRERDGSWRDGLFGETAAESLRRGMLGKGA